MRNISGVPQNGINLLGFSHTQNILNMNEERIISPTEEEIARGSTIETVNGVFDNICSICHENYVIGNEIRILSSCHHVYHKLCIDEWFKRNVICPICRHDIRTQ
jgi:GTP cyclohydrolase I